MSGGSFSGISLEAAVAACGGLLPVPGRMECLVAEGQPLAVVEAMKMENILRAERRGIVKSVNAAPGESLKVDDVIMEFE